MQKDVLIIGAGPAGIFAAFQAGMLGMSCCVVDILPYPGGQCAELYPFKPIYDIAGFPKVLAKDLVQNLLDQAEPFKPEYLFNTQIVDVKQQQDRFRAITSNGLEIEAKVVILASGNGSFVPNKPLVKNIEDFQNVSVLYSVTNPEIFRDKKVLIAGGGDSAVDWAIILKDIASRVYLIHRREKFRCNQDNFNKVKELEKQGLIDILVPYQLLELYGQNQHISSVAIQNFTTNEHKSLEVDYFLAFFGLKMDLGPLKNWGLELEQNKIKVDESFYQTNIPGMYGVGDTCHYEGKLKLIVTGFAEVCSALHHAYSRVFAGKQLHFEYSTNKGLPPSD
jgi:thioredoxin reductase (NADPH)